MCHSVGAEPSLPRHIDPTFLLNSFLRLNLVSPVTTKPVTTKLPRLFLWKNLWKRCCQKLRHVWRRHTFSLPSVFLSQIHSTVERRCRYFIVTCSKGQSCKVMSHTINSVLWALDLSTTHCFKYTDSGSSCRFLTSLTNLHNQIHGYGVHGVKGCVASKIDIDRIGYRYRHR